MYICDTLSSHMMSTQVQKSRQKCCVYFGAEECSEIGADIFVALCVTSRNRSTNFSLFYPMLTFSLRLMLTHRLDSCDHLLYRLVTRYVPCLYCVLTSIWP